VGLYEDVLRREAGLVAFLAAMASALAAIATPAPVDRGSPNGRPSSAGLGADERADRTRRRPGDALATGGRRAGGTPRGRPGFRLSTPLPPIIVLLASCASTKRGLLLGWRRSTEHSLRTQAAGLVTG
jgi:hypothetical protein